jgi:hypothetical protein
VDFIRLDASLIEAAAAASSPGMPGGPSAEDLAAWVAKIPPGEKDRLLVRLMQGEGVALAGELLRSFRQDQAHTGQDETSGVAARTAGELLEARNRLASEKKRQAAERAAREEARRAREQATARARHLDSLAGREQELWRQVETAIQTRQPSEYDRAVELLQDLCGLAWRTGTADEVARRIRNLREQHRSKRTLIQRLDQAGLPK